MNHVFPIECHTGHCRCHAHNGFLTRRGYEALAEADSSSYLDKVGSVSAMVEVEVDVTYDSKHNELNERFVDPQDLQRSLDV